MSDRSTEDEIMAELRKFGHSLTSLMQLHAQAPTWWSKHKVRRQISLTMRLRRRAEQVERHHHLAWTGGMVHQYRTHALAVQSRAQDPRTDERRVSHDQAALCRHADDVRERIVTNPRLTKVEKGIALDGIDAATAFPDAAIEMPKLLARAHKIRGIDALRYRAQVARETTRLGLERDRSPRDLPRPDRPAIAQPIQYSSVEEAARVRAEAVQGLRHAQLAWDQHGGQATGAERDELIGRWREAARSAERAGLSEDQIMTEFRNTQQNSAYVTHVHSTLPGTREVRTEQGFHATEAEAIEWAAQRVGETPWAPGTQLKTTIHQRGSATPVRLADGGLEHVTAATSQWRDSRDNPPAGQPRGESADSERLADIERRLGEMSSQREQLGRKVAVLERGLDAVTADRDRLRGELGASEGRIAELTDRNRRLSRTIEDLRTNRPDIGEILAERDRFKRERDEAVQKLVRATPEQQRYGSTQRQRAAEHGEKGYPSQGPGGNRASYLTNLRDQSPQASEAANDTTANRSSRADTTGGQSSRSSSKPVEDSLHDLLDQTRQRIRGQASVDTQSWPAPSPQARSPRIERSR